jgi:RHS repeat-associated protein
MRDTESGLDYFNARYYSPEQGRFVSVDPANAGSDPSDPQTWNGYAYVGGNPMTYTDPSGRFLSVVGIGGGAGTDILGAALPIVNAAIVGIDFLRFVFGSVSKPPACCAAFSSTPNGVSTTDPGIDSNGDLTFPSGGSGTLFGSGQMGPFTFSFGDLTAGQHLDIDKFIGALNCGAGPISTGFCAKFVRMAMEKAGINTAKRPRFAKDYGPFLKTIGCSPISPTPSPDYAPQKGDIAVLQPPSSNGAGHIEAYNGHRWVSDYFQRSSDLYPSSVYRQANVSYEVYRCE